MRRSQQQEQAWTSNRAPIPGALKVAAPLGKGLSLRPDAKPKQQPHSFGPLSSSPAGATDLPDQPAHSSASKPPAGGAAFRQPAPEHLQTAGGGSPISPSKTSGNGQASEAKGAAREAETSDPTETMARGYREVELETLLSANVVKVEALRKLVWNGIPANAAAHRPTIWQILLGYLPANRMRREATLARKRRDYAESVQQFFHMEEASRTPQEAGILHQILVDVPRTYPDVPFFQQDAIQRAMERMLYIWAIRHPASGYVQGISEIICPFILVFLSAHVSDVEAVDITKIDAEMLAQVEADTYWCTTKLLDNIQDHYTAEQPGLQRMLARFDDLVRRIDAPLYTHLLEQSMMVDQFAFKWMNCLLLRELPVRAIIRVWDTYFSQDGGFESFHIYFCTALLGHFSQHLQQLETAELMDFFQGMPTHEWSDQEIEPLLAQAYIYSTLFEDSPNHLA